MYFNVREEINIKLRMPIYKICGIRFVIVQQPIKLVNHMKKTLLYSLIIVLFSLSYQNSSAQYKNAIGGRFGIANGVTFKTFVRKDRALDFILNFQSKADYSYFRFTGLYEFHNPINNAEGLRWYYGFGGSLGSSRYKPTNDSELLLGVDGVLGLDYKFKDAPINLALDWKPTFYFTPETDFYAEGLGLSVRFTF